MMYFFLWTTARASSASLALPTERRTRMSPAPVALLECINLTAVARDVDDAFGEDGRSLNRTSEPGAPNHFSGRAVERHRSPRLHIHYAFTEHHRRGNHLAGPCFPLQLARLCSERIHETVLAPDINDVASGRGRRRNPKARFIFPAHRAVSGVERINEEILRPNEERIAHESRRRFDPASGSRTPKNVPACGIQAVNVPVAAPNVEILFRRVGRRIDPPPKLPFPAELPRFGIGRVDMSVRASEIHNPAAHDRRSPNLPFGTGLPDLGARF